MIVILKWDICSSTRPDQFTRKPSDFELDTDGQPEDQSTDIITKNISEISLEVADSTPENEVDDDSESGNDDDLFVNTNRPMVTYFYSDSENEEEDEDGDEDGEEDGER